MKQKLLVKELNDDPKWDWRVRVRTEQPDGSVAVSMELVSGGRQAMEAVARRLLRESEEAK